MRISYSGGTITWYRFQWDLPPKADYPLSGLYPLLAFIKSLATVFANKHLRRKPLNDFMSENTILYEEIFGNLDVVIQPVESFDCFIDKDASPSIPKDTKKSLSIKEDEKGDMSTKIFDFMVEADQKLSHDKAAKCVRVDTSPNFFETV